MNRQLLRNTKSKACQTFERSKNINYVAVLSLFVCINRFLCCNKERARSSLLERIEGESFKKDTSLIYKMYMAAARADAMPIVSKLYCSSSQTVLVVRKRPHVVSGGGFVVTDCSQKVVFRVDGCGVSGTEGELILRDSSGEALLLIRRKVRSIYPLIHLYIRH